MSGPQASKAKYISWKIIALTAAMIIALALLFGRPSPDALERERDREFGRYCMALNQRNLALCLSMCREMAQTRDQYQRCDHAARSS